MQIKKRVLYSKAAQRHTSCRCDSCRIVKGSKQVHCRYCDVCVSGFDHHCHWLGICVCASNYAWFLMEVAAVLLQAYTNILLVAVGNEAKTLLWLYIAAFVYLVSVLSVHLNKAFHILATK